MNLIKQNIVTAVIQSESGITLGELVARMDMPKTTVYRHVESLVQSRLLYKDDKKYVVGSVLLMWSNMIDSKHCFVDLVRPYLRELQQNTNEIVNLICVNGFSGYYMDRLEPEHSILVKAPLGTEIKLYCSGAGRAAMMTFSDEELDRYFEEVEMTPLTPKGITDRDKLRGMIADYREQGYATEFEQNLEQVHCIAVPLKLNDSLFAVSITATLLTPKEKLLGYYADLQICADKIRMIFADLQ